MSAPPIPMVYEGNGVFRVETGFLRKCSEHYGQGEAVTLAPYEDRSKASHDHLFVLVGETFKNLPEHLAGEFRDATHLRRWALIKAGFRNERTIVCASRAEALRVAAFLQPALPDAVISVSGATVVELTAQSMSMRAMGKERFQEAKDGVLSVLADLIGVEPDELSKQGREAGPVTPARTAA
jgi:hypothetical protein